VKMGPDGALYIADMYRFVIEHPEWIPADVQKNLDLRAGEDKGRIYRVYPKGAKLRPVPNLKNLPTDKLVAALDSPNGWQRDTAQQLLYWRKDRAATDDLRKLIRSSKRPITRAQALWTLENLYAATEPDVLAGLKDEDWRVRTQAIRVSESVPLTDRISAAVAELASSTNLPLAFQATLTVGRARTAESTKLFAKAARIHAEDNHFREAILSSAPAHLDGLLADVAEHPPGRRRLLRLARDPHRTESARPVRGAGSARAVRCRSAPPGRTPRRTARGNGPARARTPGCPWSR